MTTTAATSRPRGRPTTGTRIDIRIPADLLERIDAIAERSDETRAVIIRDLLWFGVGRYTPPTLP